MTIDQGIAIAGATSQFLIAVAAFWLGWRVYKYTQLTEKINQLNSALESTNLLNSTALSSDENLLAIDSIYKDGRDTSIEAARKRWATFLALQTHQQLFFAKESKLLPGDIASRSSDQVLDLLLQDPETISLVSKRGFDSKFSEYCEKRVKKLNENKDFKQQIAARARGTGLRQKAS